MTPRDHPLWPKFEAWARDNVPGQMLAVWWGCFLAGAEAERGNPKPARRTLQVCHLTGQVGCMYRPKGVVWNPN